MSDATDVREPTSWTCDACGKAFPMTEGHADDWRCDSCSRKLGYIPRIHRPRALFRDPVRRALYRELLGEDGIPVVSVWPRALPFGPDRDLVKFYDVDLGRLSTDQVEALISYVAVRDGRTPIACRAEALGPRGMQLRVSDVDLDLVPIVDLARKEGGAWTP
jgi:DNA-directed RNA polymerase subunit RPC12/RpoP